MNPTHLRVGNIVIDPFGRYAKLEKIDGRGSVALSALNGDYSWEGYRLSDILPIVLTENIFLSLGFFAEHAKPSVSHSLFYSKEVADYKYSFAYAGFRNDWGFYHSYTDAFTEAQNNTFDAISFGIKHLHELQNLWFALTQDELETTNLQ